MQEGEGVTKYSLTHTAGPNRFIRFDILDLMQCRDQLYALGLIGTSSRYCGRDDRGCVTVGCGNVSMFLDSDGSFAIGGTQTGEVVHLDQDSYTTVLECYPDRNGVVSIGPLKPPSEAMTHKTVYNLSPSAKAVVHVHSPRLWIARSRIAIPMTVSGVEYGTVEMAREVERLFREEDLEKIGMFGMEGHEDGFVSFGSSVDEAQSRMIHYFNRAL